MPRIPNVNIRTPSLPDSITLMVKVDEHKSRKVQAMLNKFPQSVEKGYRLGSQEFANKLLKLVKRCIKTGTPPKGVSWPPHSPNTTKRLGPHPLLYLTGFYYKYIQIIQNRKSIAVGLPRGLRRPSLMHGSSSLTMRQIALLLENGGATLPARPLWKPAYNQIGGMKELRKSVIKHLKNEIKKEIKKCNT